MANEVIEARDYNKLVSSLDLAGDIITKNYLYQLKKYRVVEIPQELKQLEISEYTRLYKFNKIVMDPNESMLDKMVTVLNAAYSSNATVVTLIKGNKGQTEYYMGVVSKDLLQEQDIVTLGDTFKGALQGNFPGVDITSLKNDEIEEIASSINSNDYITSVSGVASLRNKDEKDIDKYVQGIEHLVDSLDGREYSIIVISDPISSKDIEITKNGLEKLYTQLSTFQTSTINFNESDTYNYSVSETSGYTDTIGESVTQTQSYSSTSGWSESTSTSTGVSKNKGAAIGALAGVGIVAATIATGGLAAVAAAGATSVASVAGLGMGLGGAVGSGIGGTKTKTSSTSASKSGSETKSTSDAQSKNYSQSTQKSTTGSETTGESYGRSLQFNTENRTVKGLLERIDNHIERLDKCESFGAFNCAAYVITSDPETSAIVANSYNALMRGDESSLQAAEITCWSNNDIQFSDIKTYLKKYSHPLFYKDGFENAIVSAASIINSYELAIGVGMPKKSIVGLPVIQSVSFGRNVFADSTKVGRSVNLGKIHHMGKDTKVDVDLDVDSLTMHTFVTGSTGAGKSNAIYSLIERVMENTNAHFMVIEPAKGEYKDKFGHLENVRVLGTNSMKTDLLRINPFSFPSEIHVLEHIDRLIEIFNVCWPMYAAMPAVLKDAIERAYINSGWDLMKSESKYMKKYGQIIYPSFADVLQMVNIVMEESQYSADSKGDYQGALCTRVKSLTNGIYGQIFTSNELSNEVLFDSNVIVDLSRVGSTETKALIMGLLIMKMQEYRMSKHDENNTGLKHLTILEEAHNLLKRTSSEQSTDSSNLLGKSVEMLANSIAEMRTYGEGFIIADQSPGLLDMSVIRNTNTKIIMRLPDFSDRDLVGKAASLNEDQVIELARLKTGVAAVYQNNWLEPVLCKINKCKDDEKKYIHKPEVDYNYDEESIKRRIIDYLMLPAPKKLEVKTNEIAELEKNIYKIQLSASLRVDLLKYFSEKNPESIQALRNKIIFNMFNSKTALSLSNTEKHDMNSWYNLMLDKLEPSIEDFSCEEKDKIVAIIANENFARECTQEAMDIRNGFLGYVKNKRGGNV